MIFSIKIHANDVFILNQESLHTIPSSYLQFLEGFDENTKIDELEKANWRPKIINAQSIYDGYWVKIVLQNNLVTEDIGLYHNENREKKVIVVNSAEILKPNFGNGVLIHRLETIIFLITLR